MARSVENKLIHVPLDHGMNQGMSPRTAPVGTLYRVTNCRKRGPGGILESRPGLSQLPSTCIGESKHYIAGDGTTGYVYRPSFITRIEDTPLLGVTSGEVFALPTSRNWHYCGRTSTCLPVAKRPVIAPNQLAENSQSSNIPLYPPQVAVNSTGFIMTVAIDTMRGISAEIVSPEGVRQLVTWTSSASVLAARVVALGTKFFLFFQVGTNILVNTYVPSTGSGAVTYSEHGVEVAMAASTGFWDLVAGNPSTATVIYLAYQSADKEIDLVSLNSSLSSVNSATKRVGSGDMPISLYLNSVTGHLWLGFNTYSSNSGLIGTDVNASVNTSTNKTLRIRADKTQPYTVINVTSGAATAKTTIRSDLNTAFAGPPTLPFTAAIVGSNQLQIFSTSTTPGIPGALVDIDSVANGSTLNTAVGFPTTGANVYAGATYSVFSSTLATVLDYATIDASLSGPAYGPPLFGLSRSNPVPNTSGDAMSIVPVFQTSGFYTRGMYVGVASEAGVIQTGAFFNATWPVSKPDDYGRVWTLIDSGIIDDSITSRGLPVFAVSRYALLRFFDTTVDTSDATNIQLLSPPTVELVTDGFVSLSSALRFENSNASRSPAYFSPVVTGASSSYFALWAGLAAIDGPSLDAETNTQDGGTLVQAQVYEYTSTELDQPIATHRATDLVQQSVVVSGQPVELFGQSTAEIIFGVSSGNAQFAFAAGAAEVGFLHPPAFFATANNGAASTTPAAGTYQYKAVLQWVDVFGRRHLSAPSLPTSVTANGANVVTLQVYTTQCTQRQSRNSAQAVEVVIYRTLAGGTEFHETTMRATVNATLNARTLTFSDDIPDADISSNAFLYTDGGVLQNDIAPSCRFSCHSDDRVWFGGLWDPTIIQCSKILVPGEPIQTPESPSFQVQLLRPCTGLAYMDGQIVAFAEDAIFVVSGSGPNDQGNGDFSVRTLSSSIGCIDYRSVESTNSGVFFQSTQGIYLLPRGFSPPQFFGAAVQDLMQSGTDASREVLGTAIEQNQQGERVRFLLRDTSSSVGGSTVLIADSSSGEWFTDTIGAAAREMGYLTRSSSLAIGPGMMYAAPSFSSAGGTLSPVLYETATDRFDHPFVGVTSVAVEMSVQSSWLTPFGIGGYGRFNVLLGMFETDTPDLTFTLLLQVDGNTAEGSVWTFSDSTQVGIVQYRQLAPALVKGTAAQVTLKLKPTVDILDINAGYTAKFIGFTIEVDSSGGIRLTSDAEKALTAP